MQESERFTRTWISRPAIAYLAAAVSGALHGQTLLPAGFPSIAFVALVPLLVTLRAQRALHRLLAGWLWALSVSVIGGSWFPGAIVRYFDQTPGIGLLAFISTVFLTGGLYYGMATLVLPSARRFGPWLEGLVAGVWWASVELIRIEVPNRIPGWIGNPWGVVGYSQARSLDLIQIADIAGVLALSLLVVSVNAGLARVWVERRDPLRPLILPMLLLAAAFAYGEMRLADDETTTRRVPIGIVQGNVDIGDRWQRAQYGRNLETYLRLSHDILREEPSAVVFWPEAAMTFHIESDAPYRASVASVLRDPRAQVVAGGPGAIDLTRHEFANSVFTISSQGSIVGRFDKQHLIPISEAPSPTFLGGLQNRSFGEVDHFVPGPNDGPLESAAGLASIVICQEALFGSITRARVAAGGDFLLNPANDSWVGNPVFGQQLLEMARFRAIETGRELVRVSTSGPSGVIDARGRYRSIGQPAKAQAIVSSLSPRSGTTAYVLLGDTPLCIAGLFLSLMAARRSTGNRETSNPSHLSESSSPTG